jgi:pentatricopeptide repeat protein
VYQELLAENFMPNSTTYNALISAYGKLGQLDKVLEVRGRAAFGGAAAHAARMRTAD